MPTDYRVTLTGKTPLLMHQDDVEWADKMSEWKDDPGNKGKSKSGDDRSPAWRWVGALYHDGNLVSIPGGNIMRCIMEGGAMVPVPGGKNGKTFKSQTQSGLITSEFWTLTAHGKEISMSPILDLCEEADFAKHNTAAKELGFMLFVKRATIGKAKHIRVRPRFDGWEASGVVTVLDDQITKSVLTQILELAGKYKGLCDWRPGGKTPGSFGMFSATVKEAR